MPRLGTSIYVDISYHGLPLMDMHQLIKWPIFLLLLLLLFSMPKEIRNIFFVIFIVVVVNEYVGNIIDFIYLFSLYVMHKTSYELMNFTTHQTPL